MEISEDPKSIELNKPKFVEAMRKPVQTWKDGYDETGTSWDDHVAKRRSNRRIKAGKGSLPCPAERW